MTNDGGIPPDNAELADDPEVVTAIESTEDPGATSGALEESSAEEAPADGQPDVSEPTPPVSEPAPWGVEVDAASQVCYAMSHNRVPVVRGLKVRNETAGSAKQLTVRVHSEWAIGDRPPTKDVTVVVDAPAPGGAIEMNMAQVKLDDVAVAKLEEAVPANLIFDLSDDAGNTQRTDFPFRVFARNQWLRDPAFAEIIAAFVQPNHPTVNEVLDDARKILRDAGHDDGLSGYQAARRGQHHKIAEAIFLALQRRITGYINPPASFEDEGQKLRPLDEVLEQKQGTCIDLACAYASCLEQAGLYPVIFLVRGHAFSGYLDAVELPDGRTTGAQLNASALKSWPEIVSCLDSKLVFGVETVGIPNGISFDEAQDAVRGYLVEQEMQALIDVHQSRWEIPILPLPARVTRDGIETLVIDNGPSGPPVIERRDATTRKLLPTDVPARVQSWKNSLLDLSFNNRLLNLRVDLRGIPLVPPPDRLGHIEDWLNNGDPLQIVGLDGSEDFVNQAGIHTAQNELEGSGLTEAFDQTHHIIASQDVEKLRFNFGKTRSEARRLEADTGANSLYLTIGQVKWGPAYGTTGRQYLSPIFLIPIRMGMARGDTRVQIQMDDTESTTVNHCLIEALRYQEKLQLQWFSDDMSDDLGLDIEAGMEAMRAEFRERGLDAKGFIVESAATISILNYRKFRLWKDLEDNWEKFSESPVVNHLINSARERFDDPANPDGTGAPPFSDGSLLNPQPADGSQTRAIVRALAGQSFVLEGPPGTGKSQTITNLLANALHQGKKVLFVAEKQAALSVVAERLDQVGLGPYCLALHDRGTKPKVLLEQLREALDQDPPLDQRAFDHLEDEFDTAIRYLDEYRKNVHGENAAGFSFASAYTRLKNLGDGPSTTVPRALLEVDEETVNELRHRLVELESFTQAAQVGPEHPWAFAGPIDFNEIDPDRLAELIDSTLRTFGDLGALTDPARGLVHNAAEPDELRAIGQLLALQEQAPLPTTSEWSAIVGPDWQETTQTALVEMAGAMDSAAALLGDQDSLLDHEDLSDTATRVQEASKAFVLVRKRRVRSELGALTNLSSLEGLDPSQVADTVETIAAASTRLRVGHSQLAGSAGLADRTTTLPTNSEALEKVRSTVDQLRNAAELVVATTDLASDVREYISNPGTPVPGLWQTVLGAAEELSSLTNLLAAPDGTVKRWSGDLGLVRTVDERCRPVWSATVADRTFLPLKRWLNLKQHLEPLRAHGLDEICTLVEIGDVAAIDAPNTLERGLMETTMKVRAEETDLDVFDRSSHDRRVHRFIELLSERREIAQLAIPHRLFKTRKVNGGINTGQVGKFRAEVNNPKKKRGKSVRYLIDTFPEIVSDLAPCFLMSPDSVAQFIPPGRIDFDLVVFDEASQIPVPDAIGSLGRSKACVVVGDSKQMPPTKVAVAGSGEDDESDFSDDQVIEEDSLLEEALAAGYELEWLSWHYRSQDESLIDFSNTHYYDGRLATFPSPTDNRPDLGIFYKRVDGQFDHGKTRTNPVEADAMIAEVVLRLDEPATSDLTYGFVTLNKEQRTLIENKLAKYPHPRLRELLEEEDPEQRIFVLNLEEVQGRERDVIVMGTSFSKRRGEGTLPLNFGPLTNSGGERRLNVAVTRARKQVVVVSSFDPEDMREPKSLGLIHLKEYLARAARQTSDLENRETDDDNHQHSDRDHIREISLRLEDKGIEVEVLRGLSQFRVDLALRLSGTPAPWLVAVLVDGNSWNQRPMATDRDAVPASFLEKVMGWPHVARIWLPSWNIEPDQVVADLVDLVHSAASDPRPNQVVSLPPTGSTEIPSGGHLLDERGDSPEMAPTVSEPEPTVESPQLPGEEPFQSWQDPGQIGSVAMLEAFHKTAFRTAQEIIETEAPVELKSVIKRVANCFGLGTVREKRIWSLTPLLDNAHVESTPFGHFVWVDQQDPINWLSFRRTDRTQRALKDIAPHEVANAMVAVVRQSIAFEVEELVQWAAEFFGSRRVTESTRQHLHEIVRWAVEEGLLVEENGLITAS